MLHAYSEGIVANRKATWAIVSECRKFKDLLILINVCVSRTMLCIIRWGIGNFEYGNILRTAHSPHGVKKRNSDANADKFLRFDVGGDPLSQSETAYGYFPAVDKCNFVSGVDCASPSTALPKNARRADGPTSNLWQKLHG